MESKKPNNFREAALSHIPADLVQSMLQSTKVDTEGLGGILEAISKNTPSTSPLPIKPEASKDRFVTVAINDIALKVSTDPYQGAMTMILFLLATVWSKDKKIAKILKAFNFSLQDANGISIYPPKKGKKK